MKEVVKYRCKVCGKVCSNKYNKVRTYCGYSCRNKDKELLERSNRKRKQTWEEQGGHPMSKQEVQKKQKKTMTDLYGVSHALQDQQFIKKVKETKLERYGDSNYNNYHQSLSTKKERYGTLYFNSKYAIDRRKLKEQWDHITLLDDILTADLSKPFNIQCNSCGRKWEAVLSNNYVPSCSHCSNRYVKVSKGQQEVLEYITQLIGKDITVLPNDRSLLNGSEVDIYIPSLNIAIEYNGIYYHSSKYKPKNYHYNKSRLCMIKGVQLIHIYEHQWINQREVVKSILQSKLGKIHSRVYARECQVVSVDASKKKLFLQQTHLQGTCNSSINLGLVHNGELVALLTMGKSRFKRDIQYELLRFSSKLGTTVVGGFSKLFTAFVKQYSPSSVISYANRDISNGNVYLKSNFTFTGFTKPGYWYVKNSNVYPRQSFQKHKLKDKLEVFNVDLTEEVNMSNNGYYRLYNSGNYTFIWKKEKR